MITKEQWKQAKNSRTTLSELTNKEIKEYFANGGLMTRREKGGTFTFWTMDEDGNMRQVKVME